MILISLYEYVAYLYMIQIVQENESDTTVSVVFDIWIMKDYGVKKSWTKCYHVGPLWNLEHPLLFLKIDRLICQVSDDRPLVFVNLNTQQVQEYDIRVCRKSSHNCVVTLTCM